jgi:superfamily II DNA/RNA helicase
MLLSQRQCAKRQVLVLDEADRILDLGFQSAMNAIIQNLPRTRQTLLFSATQTKSVSDLARLSLNDPDYVSAHQTSEVIPRTYIALFFNYKQTCLYVCLFIQRFLTQAVCDAQQADPSLRGSRAAA